MPLTVSLSVLRAADAVEGIAEVLGVRGLDKGLSSLIDLIGLCGEGTCITRTSSPLAVEASFSEESATDVAAGAPNTAVWSVPDEEEDAMAHTHSCVAVG